MSEQLNDDIFVTHTMGGMMEFQKTGIYPHKLRIASVKYDHVWRIKVTDESQSGILKIRRVPVYHYIYDEEGLRMQQVGEGTSGSEWFYPNMRIIMQD